MLQNSDSRTPQLQLFTRLALTLAFLMLAGAAQADSITIGPDNCDSCAGLTLGLEINQVGDDVEIFLSYSAPDGWTGDEEWENYTSVIKGGFGGVKGWGAEDITLHSITIDGDDYAYFDQWSSGTEANTNSNGEACSKGTTTDKGCVYSFSGDGSIDLEGGGTAVFAFWIEDATVMDDLHDWKIGGQICDNRDDPSTCKGHIISESIPEPTAALCFGVGLAAFAAFRRRQA